MNLRKIIKRTIKTGFLLLVLPVYTLYLLLCLTGTTDAVFMSFSQALSLIPGKTGIYIRAAFYRLACTDTSDEISVGFLTIFSHADTTIEKGVYIGPQCNIGKCSIGANSLLGSGVHVLSGKRQHEFSDESKLIQEQEGFFEKIKIGEDCWVGNTAVILCNVASKTIVGANSTVISTFERGSILVGNPAFVKNKRSL